MKKLNKKDWFNILIILSLFIILFISIYILGYNYGSQTDWICQHYALPNFLRILFYDSKKILPNFAFNLGAGQNIYYLVYHGLFNPLIMISYLFPYIKMSTYIIILNIIIILLDAIFMYKWLNKHFNKKITFFATFIFILSGPLVYHSHRHLMFTDYMPFLILALSCVDKYFESNKKTNLIFLIFLIITISYLYSVGSILTIFIYGIYKHLKTNKKIIFKDTFKYILTLIIPIIMASFIILPTFYTIMTGRSDTTVNISILDLIIPNINIEKAFYNAYGIGIPFIIIIALINNILNQNKEKKILNIILILIFFIPAFNYILNGFMYIDSKSIIPLLPLYVYIISDFINDLLKNKYNKNTTYICLAIIIFLGIFNYNTIAYYLLIGDFILTLITFKIYKQKHNYYLLIIPVLVISSISFIIVNCKDNLITLKDFKQIEYDNSIKINYTDNNLYRTSNNKNLLESSNNINSKDYYSTSIYTSVANPYYTSFIKDIFKTDFASRHYHELTQNSNLLFNIYMGNKYLISDYPYQGYHQIDKNIYVNNDVFTIGYATNKIMSTREFNTLKYPYTIDALLNYIIVNKDIPNVYQTNIKEYNDTFISNNNVTTEKYTFNIKEEKTTKIKLNNLNDEIIILTFDMLHAPNCTYCSNSITINNVKNTISGANWKYYNYNDTFHYVISNYKDKTLEMTSTKGKYEIENIKIYTMDYNIIKNIKHDEFIINKDKTNGDTIYGNIIVNNDGYFNISIPYDKGFTIKVDNKKIDYQLTNTSFIGFPITKGNHSIEITYKAPFSKIGQYLSICGIIIYILILFNEKRRKIWKK